MRCAPAVLAALVPLVAGAQPAAEQPVPLGISLGVSDETELTIAPGTPLTFTAEFENSAAADALAAAQVAEATKAQLDAAVAAGDRSREEADAELARLDAPPAVPAAITIHPVADRFSWALADGSAPPWQAMLVGPEVPAAALDGTQTVAVTFVVAPEATQAVAPGEYRVHLHYSGEGAPAGEWTGSTDSDEVVVTVEAAPAAPTPEQQWEQGYSFSLYHLAVADFTAATADAQAMLTAQPDSVLARVQLGRAKEGQHDLAGARAAYEDALEQDLKQDPGGEPPIWLEREIRRVSELIAPPPAPQNP